MSLELVAHPRSPYYSFDIGFSKGYAATCFVKIPVLKPDVFQIAMRNFLRKTFGLNNAVDFLAYEVDESVGTRCLLPKG